MTFDLHAHLVRQMTFSGETFGPGERTNGVLDHISKEVGEVRTSGGAAEEWVDLVVLSLDGLTRRLRYHSGAAVDDLDDVASASIELILEKQGRNESRTWPDWRNADPDKAIEHSRAGDGDAWAWYAGTSEDGVFPIGPHATRDDAIAEAREYGWEQCVVAEATNPPVKLSGYLCDVEDLLERADERLLESDRVNYEFDEDGVFTVTTAQAADLASSLRAAADDWQRRHGLVFKVRTFAAMRSEENVALEADGE